ncbi:hypothetical protein PIB30_049075 [Stylosanthes scabra]|uniref:Cytochrome P450 n=1 Tax=Stylosanthes scabra TaxID=79078 RepID=A0ABU6YEL7_9FABA|nr:hypothetical protein [Stylosanthes scabra]
MFLHLGRTPTLVVSSAKVLNEIMKNHELTFSNRFQTTAMRILMYGRNNIGFQNYGENWKQKRNICVHELLSPKMMQSIRLIREEEVMKLVNNNLREAINNGSDVNLSEMIFDTLNSITCKCVLGCNTQDYGYENAKGLARKMINQLGVLTLGDHFPWLSWVEDVLSGQVQEFKETFGAFDALYDEVIVKKHKKKKMRTENHHENSFVDILIQLQEDGHYDLSNGDIKGIIMDLFAAGSATTSAVVEWAMTELMKNPITMKKAQEEVRRVVGQKCIAEESHINKMEFLKYVVKETLRLHPSAPLLLPRETSTSVKLNGYDIPEKTMVCVNVWAIQRDPEYWERAEEFIPERHEHSKVRYNGQDSQFAPFGFGRRGCLGMSFALDSAEYMLANLLCCFNWNMPPQGIDITEADGLVSAMKFPLHLNPIPFSFKQEQ